MRSFETVLREVEQVRREPVGRAPRRLPLAPETPYACPASHRGGLAAYADQGGVLPPDLRRQFLSEVETARGSRTRLRQLRRRIAIALHPDRAAKAGGASLLAELNARIDAALKEPACQGSSASRPSSAGTSSA